MVTERNRPIMIKNLCLLFLLLLMSFFQSQAQDNVTFKAMASPNTMVVGQQFRLTYTTNKAGKDLRIPDLSDFDFLFGPVQEESVRQIINNNQSVTEISYAFTYTLMATKEGTFNLPPATIKIGNSEYKSNELTIKVLPKNNQNDAVVQQAESGSSGINNEGLFIRMHVSKNSVYENEGFLVTFKLYTLYDIGGFENIKYPEFEGFIAQEIELSNSKQAELESYNGRTYRTAILKQTILYPIRSGKITIPSGRVDVVAQVRNQQRVRSIFDDFFDTHIPVKKSLTSSSATIDVKPLPSGKPASYSGALGDYSMTSSISSNNVKANESVTIKVTISGNGNVKLIKNPNVNFPNDFEIYDPKVTENIKVTAVGVTDRKSVV